MAKAAEEDKRPKAPKQLKKPEPKPTDMVSFTMSMTRAEWEKLNALARYRSDHSKPRKVFTPEATVRDFIQNCVTDGGSWEDPSTTAVKHVTRRAERSAKSK